MQNATPMPAKRAKPAPAEADPDRLVRQQAGIYRTEDERFDIQQTDNGWFLVDTTQANELGQPLMLGPFATLAAVKGALPDARTAKAAPKAPRRSTARAAAPKAERAPEPPRRSWIDDLPSAEATRVRSLIRRLEAQGITKAEELVRSDMKGLLPAVASRLIEQRLDALVDELPANARQGGHQLVRRAAQVLSADGTKMEPPLPRWALVEIGPEGEPPNRRIVIRNGR
jgi:hypothetical protein